MRGVYDKYKERIAELFYKLVVDGGCTEIYCFRKLVEADLNVIPDIKLNEHQVDALIPLKPNLVVQCECTLSERLDEEKVKSMGEVKRMFESLGVRCKTLVIGRKSFCQTICDSNFLSFDEISDKASVVSKIFALVTA